MALVWAGSTSRAALSIYLAPEQLAERSSLIVEATVLDRASGYDPAGKRLATYVTLGVEVLHAGTIEGDRVVIRQLGGRFGELVHDVDAVAEYVVGEKVFVFLERAKDGSARTVGMFLGKYRIVEDSDTRARYAIRELDGRGRIFGRPTTTTEKIRVSDLASLAVSVQSATQAVRPIATAPPELERIVWDPDKFAPASLQFPTRWEQIDSGTPLAINVDPARDPLGDPALAVAEIQRALDAWTNVPESRLSLSIADAGFDYLSTALDSPAVQFSGIDVVLFGDPYDDISDPIGCGGTLAIGGYWRSATPGGTVNGITFYPALQAYVIFNNGFECFLGQSGNLAEVATHELGHAVGFGHSPVGDAIMRASAYGGRGPRLGIDDVDATHCHYPHTFTVLSPNGGETLDAGVPVQITWSSSAEGGPDAGTVDVEYSANGGIDWQTVVTGTNNDGSYTWSVSQPASDQGRIRITRPNHVSPPPAGYPSICSSDASDASFHVVETPPVAGAISDGAGGGLRIDKDAGQLRLSWGASCSPEADNHAIYAGSLDTLRAGGWDLQPVNCSAGVDLAEYLTAAAGNRFFLVAPMAGTAEGALGASATGAPRPLPLSPCGTREAASTCK